MSPSPPIELALVLRLMLALAGVLTLAAISLRWALPRLARGAGRAGRLRIVEVKSVDRTSKVVLIEVDGIGGDDRELLVAFGGHGATRLGDWTKPAGAGAGDRANRAVGQPSGWRHRGRSGPDVPTDLRRSASSAYGLRALIKPQRSPALGDRCRPPHSSDPPSRCRAAWAKAEVSRS